MRMSKQLKRRAKGFFKAKGHVDAVAGNRIVGWAFADGAPVHVEAVVDNKVIASVEPTKHRADIASAFPGWGRAGKSGFTLDLPENALPVGKVADVSIIVRPHSMIHSSRKLTEITMVGPATIEKVAAPPETGRVGPFPKNVIDTVAAVWPEACEDLHSAAGQKAFVEKLYVIARTPSLRSNDAITSYIRYVRTIWTHCKFVEKFFPTLNPTAKENSTDFHCKPNSVQEIFPIAHQLYVLKSYGIQGDFAEFGCFKGFSSAMLSLACRQLDLKMHIFDSFEGLPPSEGSGYQTGEYAGSLEEVRANISRYGAIEMTEFHKGFFSDTFKNYRPPPLMCLWMDVDLELSSRDLMVVADRLDPRSTLFSHESSPDMFVGDRVVSAPRPDNPIPPILDRFEEMQRPLTGRFVRGTTGAFWAREGGIPVMDNAVVMDLAERLGE